MITVPRGLLLALAALFSTYHVVLGIYSLRVPSSPVPSIVAMVLYAVATVISLWPTSPTRMPLWLAAFNLAVCGTLPILVSSTLDGSRNNGYATWYVAAVGVLMTITAARKRQATAWAGVGFLAAYTVVWAGPAAVASQGVFGSVLWVGVAILLAHALTKAGRDANQYGLAEREASDWQAAQEAHLYERRVRLAHTNRLAAPMLRRIVERGGVLTEVQRQECRYLEAAIRDEIRGRKLLNDEVRFQVMAARRRGAIVSLLDEGGIDDLSGQQLEELRNTLAAAIARTTADRIIARSVADNSETAVTVVGLSSEDSAASALGQDSSDDEVDLWLEIPRPAPAGSDAGR
jgi:hypothetical protein